MPSFKNPSQLLFVFLLAGTAACTLGRHDHYKVREQPKGETVFGCVWLRDSLWIDKCEITNLDWLECLYWLKQTNDTATCRKMLPDTLVWRHPLAFSEPYVEYYFRHPAYRNYPVVGISPEQAVLYCQWRTERVNEFIALQKGLIKKISPDSHYIVPQYVRYRLPSRSEWEFAARCGYVPKGKHWPYFPALVDRKGRPVNHTHEFENTAQETEAVNFGQPNYYGIYGMAGNVSEFIAGGEMVMGLNYQTTLDGIAYTPGKGITLQPDSASAPGLPVYRYREPVSWIGLRCVCDVLISQRKK